MLAKYDGICSATGEPIYAGETHIENFGNGWQIAQKPTGTTKPYGATISMAWSEPVQDRWGDEYLKHYASFGDDDGEPIGKIWSFGSDKKAILFAEQLCDEHNLEDVLNETMW